MKVEWDEVKAAANHEKHGVSFAQAAEVLKDPLSVTYQDPDHSVAESRFLTFGHDNSGRILVVAHTDRGEAIRVISARRVTRAERKAYEEVTTKRS